MSVVHSQNPVQNSARSRKASERGRRSAPAKLPAQQQQFDLLTQLVLNNKTDTAKDVAQMQQIIDELNLNDDAAKLIAQTPFDEQRDTYPLGWWAALALGKLGYDQAVQPLIEALRNGPDGGILVDDIQNQDDEEFLEADAQAEAIAHAAAFALAQLGVKTVGPLIEVLTRDPARDMRQWAALVLGQIGDSRAVAPLVEALHDQDTFVRSSAAGALGYIGDRRAVLPLSEALYKGAADDDDDGGLAYGATLALARIGTPEAFATLEWTQKQPDSFFGKGFWGGQVKPEAAKVLAGLVPVGGSPVPARVQ